MQSCNHAIMQSCKPGTMNVWVHYSRKAGFWTAWVHNNIEPSQVGWQRVENWDRSASTPNNLNSVMPIMSSDRQNVPPQIKRASLMRAGKQGHLNHGVIEGWSQIQVIESYFDVGKFCGNLDWPLAFAYSDGAEMWSWRGRNTKWPKRFWKRCGRKHNEDGNRWHHRCHRWCH